MRKVLLVSVLAVAMIFGSAAVAQQQRHDSAVMVMDVSETTSGDNQIAEGARILKDMNQRFPDYVQSAGVMAFGYQAPPTARWLAPVGNYSRDNIASALGRIEEGDGPTPMGAALSRAGKGIKDARGKTALIIVSDGLDNGAANPVAVVADLKKAYGSNLCVFPIQLGDSIAGGELLSALVKEAGCGKVTAADMLRSGDQVQGLVDYIFPGEKKPAPVCPAPPPPKPGDADGDGVTDDQDECPGTLAGAHVDSRGCWVLENLKFDSGSAVIKEQYYPILNQVANVLNQNPGVKVEVQGHTDSQGAEESNQVLSQKRAQAVVDYLVGKGVSESQVNAAGYGETQPVASNETAEGRADNRRIELAIQ